MSEGISALGFVPHIARVVVLPALAALPGKLELAAMHKCEITKGSKVCMTLHSALVYNCNLCKALQTDASVPGLAREALPECGAHIQEVAWAEAGACHFRACQPSRLSSRLNAVPR